MSDRLFNITNYYEHPTDSNYVVFHFIREEQALEFEKLLNENKIEFEKFVEKGENIIWMFGIHRRKEKEAVKLNFTAIGKHREKFIPTAFFRWVIILFTLGCIGLALVGYLKSGTGATSGDNKTNVHP
ncbi:MAG: hypothetical protein ACOZCO_00835 [Bacteroidota bacterium]